MALLYERPFGIFEVKCKGFITITCNKCPTGVGGVGVGVQARNNLNVYFFCMWPVAPA